MKNKIFLIIFFLIFNLNVAAETIKIEAKNITLDKDNYTSIFENEVVVKAEGNIFKSDYVKYDKQKGVLLLQKNITASDDKNNKIKANQAVYFEKDKIFKTKGPTEIITAEDYTIKGDDIIFNDKNGLISSSRSSVINDREGNEIFLESFEFETKSNIFKSIGLIKIKDSNKNNYEFSQIYIDTKKKEILGTDIKAYLNQENFKINKKNKPRVFANMIELGNEKSSFNKSVFTICDYRKDDKCPPWTIQASKMLHDNKKKTIYYDNAIIKVYDIPIFYFPKLSHPDPSVDRRSGFLPPSFSDSKNLGSGVSIPYFWALNKDKNFTLTNKLYVSENPLFLGEYHQAFNKASLLTDFGYTKGYKKSNAKKKAGSKSHIFAKFIKNFDINNNTENTLSLSIQNVSDDKYLKLYKIDSRLTDYNTNTLESSLSFTHEDEDIFFGINTSIFETLSDSYNDKYEYILPEITIDKNLISDENLGSLDLQTSYKARIFDTNKLTNFLVNDFNWNFKEINFNSGIKSKFLSTIKNINYEAKNVGIYKEDTTSEIYGALGYFSEINLQKKTTNSDHLLKPKMLVRYSPGSMRKETSGYRLDPINAFTLNRLDNINNFETGLNATLGFEYEYKKNKKELDFSVAQIINQKENKKMAEKTSLDEKLSDLVGITSYKLNENIKLNHNFSLDQNYSDLNYNELGMTLDLNPMKIDFSYLEESKHIGDQQYFKTKIDFLKGEDGLFSFETKRNLITNSSEFYNLSYEYINDCLRAGLVYRREFYSDSELEPENSLMFKVTLTPFGNLNTPSFAK